MQHADHRSQLARLRRVQGQVGGITAMIEQDRYCVDVLTQLRAARAALRRVEENVLREHLEHCVRDAVNSGNQRQARTKVDEILDVLSRFSG